MFDQILWQGEKSRPLQLRRPCECGCDERDGERGVGYLTASDSNGQGFTLWIEEESVYEAIRRCLPDVHFSAN